MDTALEVLKWVFLILLAGFIGQFGKSLSTNIIEYLKKKRNKTIASGAEQISGAERDARAVEMKENQTPSTAEKKALKAHIKAQKKSHKGEFENS
ncbi:MAG: hypothetical protein NTZ51_11605 [Proteobacteria bacterium]|nr:hypothetical protein [Pseudomonadota bacterium]